MIPDKRTSLVAQTVKRLPTMQETRVQSLGQDDLEEQMATHSSVLAWKIPWTEEPGRPQSMGLPRQEYWSGLPFPSPGDLPNPGIEPRSPALQTDALTSEPPGKPIPKLEKSPCSNIDPAQPKINNFLNLVKINKYKRTQSRTSLAVQWVKPCASNAGRMGSITGQGKIPNAGRCSQKTEVQPPKS